MATIKVPVQPAMRQMTMRVQLTGVQTWKLRLWLGTVLIRMAARVMGCGIRVE